MPSLAEQITLQVPDREVTPIASRLLLKCGRNYKSAVKSFEPYDRIQEPQLGVRSAASSLIRKLAEKPKGRRSFLYVNNRLEGNALSTIAAILALLALD
jgi:hypothetical protein